MISFFHKNHVIKILEVNSRAHDNVKVEINGPAYRFSGVTTFTGNLKEYICAIIDKECEKNPTWFFRELIEEGYDLDDEGFCQATAWMDEPERPEY